MANLKKWVNALGISLSDYQLWSQKLPSGELFTPWVLRTGKLSVADYMAWAKHEYQLPVLADNYQETKADKALWQELNSLQCWSKNIVPLAKYKDVIYLVCIEPLQTDFPFKHQFTLGTPEQLEFLWKRWQLFNPGLAKASTTNAKILPEPINEEATVMGQALNSMSVSESEEVTGLFQRIDQNIDSNQNTVFEAHSLNVDSEVEVEAHDLETAKENDDITVFDPAALEKLKAAAETLSTESEVATAPPAPVSPSSIPAPPVTEITPDEAPPLEPALVDNALLGAELLLDEEPLAPEAVATAPESPLEDLAPPLAAETKPPITNLDPPVEENHVTIELDLVTEQQHNDEVTTADQATVATIPEALLAKTNTNAHLSLKPTDPTLVVAQAPSTDLLDEDIDDLFSMNDSVEKVEEKDALSLEEQGPVMEVPETSPVSVASNDKLSLDLERVEESAPVVNTEPALVTSSNDKLSLDFSAMTESAPAEPAAAANNEISFSLDHPHLTETAPVAPAPAVAQAQTPEEQTIPAEFPESMSPAPENHMTEEKEEKAEGTTTFIIINSDVNLDNEAIVHRSHLFIPKIKESYEKIMLFQVKDNTINIINQCDDSNVHLRSLPVPEDQASFLRILLRTDMPYWGALPQNPTHDIFLKYCRLEASPRILAAVKKDHYILIGINHKDELHVQAEMEIEKLENWLDRIASTHAETTNTKNIDLKTISQEATEPAAAAEEQAEEEDSKKDVAA